jgi:TonB family protein
MSPIQRILAQHAVPLGVFLFTPQCVLLAQAAHHLDATQFAQARALCGPLADDSVLQDPLWWPPPDAVFSARLANVQSPKLLPSPQAILEYPDHLRRQGIQGQVIAAAIVRPSGRVEPGSVKVSATPHPDFTPPVEHYLERVHFTPGQLNGRPIRVCIVMPIDFGIAGH